MTDKNIEIQCRVFGDNGGQWDNVPTVPVTVPKDIDPLRLDVHVALMGMAWNINRAHAGQQKIAIMRYMDDGEIRTVMPSTIFRYPHRKDDNDIEKN
jgi:hypothetical protein